MSVNFDTLYSKEDFSFSDCYVQSYYADNGEPQYSIKNKIEDYIEKLNESNS